MKIIKASYDFYDDEFYDDEEAFWEEHHEDRDEFLYENRGTPYINNNVDVDMTPYEGKGFNEDQLEEIYLGLNHGLDPSQVELYADPSIDEITMWKTRNDLEGDLEQQYRDIERNESLDEYRESVSDYERGTTPYYE